MKYLIIIEMSISHNGYYTIRYCTQTSKYVIGNTLGKFYNILDFN